VSIRVIVTGGAGFIGTLLVRQLLAGPVAAGGTGPAPVGELVLADLAAPPPDVAADPRVRAVTGDLAAVTSELAATCGGKLPPVVFGTHSA
jgi:nucleoside-diphosphate-sugar epimerase